MENTNKIVSSVKGTCYINEEYNKKLMCHVPILSIGIGTMDTIAETPFAITNDHSGRRILISNNRFIDVRDNDMDRIVYTSPLKIHYPTIINTNESFVYEIKCYVIDLRNKETETMIPVTFILNIILDDKDREIINKYNKIIASVDREFARDTADADRIMSMINCCNLKYYQ